MFGSMDSRMRGLCAREGQMTPMERERAMIDAECPLLPRAQALALWKIAGMRARWRVWTPVRETPALPRVLAKRRRPAARPPPSADGTSSATDSSHPATNPETSPALSAAGAEAAQPQPPERSGAAAAETSEQEEMDSEDEAGGER